MMPESIAVTDSNTVRITVKGAQNGLTIDTWTVENASNSKNLYMNSIGASGSFLLNNMKLSYLKVWENGTGLVVTQEPESTEQEVGKKFAITVQAEGEGLTYQWYVKESGAKEFKVSSNKTSSYAYTMQSYMNNRQVYCVITDQYGNQVTTETVTIHVTQ